MSLNKVDYIARTTPVSSSNLNDIQDAILQLPEDIGFHDIRRFKLTGITSLPKTFSGATGVTANHELVVDGFARVSPSGSMGSEWSVTCGSGTITLNGTFSGSTSTTVIVTVGIPDHEIVELS